MLVTIKSNQACLNAPFGSILLTFEGDELVRCELSEEAVEKISEVLPNIRRLRP